MRVPADGDDNELNAPWGRLGGPTATFLSLPISGHHTVRSVAQEAYRSLWAEDPDRPDRWRRVGNMDQVYGVGRPLRTITKDVIQEVFKEMVEMEMPGPVIWQHLEDFACLMFWADAHGFVQWSRKPEVGSGDDGST